MRYFMDKDFGARVSVDYKLLVSLRLRFKPGTSTARPLLTISVAIGGFGATRPFAICADADSALASPRLRPTRSLAVDRYLPRLGLRGDARYRRRGCGAARVAPPTPSATRPRERLAAMRCLIS